MGTTDATDLSKIVNASGFLFQLRVEEEVKSISNYCNLEVLAREHPWVDIESGKSGYIDLILADGIVRLVIECKRTKDAKWVFLMTKDKSPGGLARYLWISSRDKQEYRSGWFDLFTNPTSHFSEFCVVRGQGEGDSPMLERISSTLLDAVECLAVEEVLLSSRYGSRGRRYLYLPVIVTNANLYVCHFGLEEISLIDGKLANGEFEPVPFIRFHKSLTTKLTQNSAADTIEQANKDKLRTVFVVQANHFKQFLSSWKVQLDELNKPPW
jgi:hypothetical protein